MNKYTENWERFYQTTYKKLQKQSLWAVPAESAVETDWPFFNKLFSAELTCLDVGCGTGEQSRFLAHHYAQVVGLEVSETALEIARQNDDTNKLYFRHFDICDKVNAAALHQEFGDCNLYIRGVLHQIKEEDRENMRASLQILAGKKGRIFINEVGSNIRDYLDNLGTRFSALPAQMRMVLLANLAPLGLSQELLIEWFPQASFTILDSGQSALSTNLQLTDGTLLKIPSIYAVLENRS